MNKFFFNFSLQQLLISEVSADDSKKGKHQRSGASVNDNTAPKHRRSKAIDTNDPADSQSSDVGLTGWSERIKQPITKDIFSRYDGTDPIIK